METTLIGLIAITFALVPLRWSARRAVWLGTLVTALCAPLSDIVPTARAVELSYPAFTEVVNVSANPGNSKYPQIASKDGALFTVWMDGANVLYRRIKIVEGKANPDATVNITNFGPNEGTAVSPQIATDPLGGTTTFTSHGRRQGTAMSGSGAAPMADSPSRLPKARSRGSP